MEKIFSVSARMKISLCQRNKMEFNFPSPSNVVIAEMEFSGKVFQFFRPSFCMIRQNPADTSLCFPVILTLKKKWKTFLLGGRGEDGMKKSGRKGRYGRAKISIFSASCFSSARLMDFHHYILLLLYLS